MQYIYSTGGKQSEIVDDTHIRKGRVTDTGADRRKVVNTSIGKDEVAASGAGQSNIIDTTADTCKPTYETGKNTSEVHNDAQFDKYTEKRLTYAICNVLKSKKAKRVFCQYCRRYYIDTAADADKHLPTPSNRQPDHECSVCFKLFVSACRLSLHTDSIHGDSTFNPYMCPICKKEVLHPFHLKDHMLTHSDVRPYKCDGCTRSFKTRGRLNMHIRNYHSSRKRFGCKVCLKRFRTKKYLDAHMLTHTGERPHLCETCGKAFSLKHNLKVHMKIHAKSSTSN